MRERTPHDSFDDLFDEDLRGRLGATAAEHRGDLTSHLWAALSRVKSRGTPLRGAERFGSDGAVRLRFADGTSVLARGDGKGGLGFAAVAVLRGTAVLLTDVHPDGDSVHGVLAWGRNHKVSIRVIGEDQPG